MEAYTVTYKKGVQIITHASGVVNVYVTDDIKEHKTEVKERIVGLEKEVLELDKQIVLCKGETLIAKVKNIFRRSRPI